MYLNRMIRITAIILFGVIIVLGESFKLGAGTAKVSLPLLIFGGMMALFAKGKLKIHLEKMDLMVYLWGFLFLSYSIVGFIAGNKPGDIFEDLYPMLFFLAMFIFWRSMEIADWKILWHSIIVFGCLAVLKVFLIAVVPYDIAWDNNWQAAKEGLPLMGVYRIILKGGDIFISIALVSLITKVMMKNYSWRLMDVLLILAATIAIFISLSRSSFLGIGLIVVFSFIAFRKHYSTRKLTIFSTILIFTFLALLPFFNALSFAAKIFEARTDAFDADDISVSFRQNENALIIEKAGSAFFLGNGMGSYFYMPLSGSDKADDRSIYAHNFSYWLLLKTGIPGLLLFYLIFLRAAFQYFKYIRQSSEENPDLVMVMSIFSAGLVVFVISFLANKFSTLSGSLLLALFLAGSVFFKNQHDSRIRL